MAQTSTCHSHLPPSSTTKIATGPMTASKSPQHMPESNWRAKMTDRFVDEHHATRVLFSVVMHSFWHEFRFTGWLSFKVESTWSDGRNGHRSSIVPLKSQWCAFHIVQRCKTYLHLALPSFAHTSHTLSLRVKRCATLLCNMLHFVLLSVKINLRTRT